VTRFARAVRRVSIGWLLFLLEPLSRAGLDFPFFVVLFNITVFLGLVALALVLRPGKAPAAASVRRPETRLGHLGGPWYHLYAIF
jgi:hypothetical protein